MSCRSLMIAAMLTVGIAPRLAADTIYSNLGPGNSLGNSAISGSRGGATTFGATYAAATPFQTSAAYLLTEIDVPLYGATAIVQLREDGGGVPGGVIASWTVSFPSFWSNTLQPSQVINGISSTLLRKDATYWIAVLPADTGDTWWIENNTGQNNIKADGSGDGLNWFGYTSNANVAFAVRGTAVFQDVSAGWAHTCAVLGNGVVQCWGNNSFGQGPATRSANTGSFSRVSAGALHTCALTAAGTVECWGLNTSGQAPASRAATTGSYAMLTAGALHTCGLRIDGVVECWGANSFGQAPATHSAAAGTFRSVAAGGYHTCALRDDGGIECWGNDGNGQAPVLRTPTTVGLGFSVLTAGAGHSCAANNNVFGSHAGGNLECWGNNTFGQAPPVVVGPTFAQLSGGGLHTCGILINTNPIAYFPPVLGCWGNNSYGQAGGLHTPTAGGGNSFLMVTAGLFHTCAINAAQFLECWGNNTSGQAPAVRVPSY